MLELLELILLELPADIWVDENIPVLFSHVKECTCLVVCSILLNS